MVTIQKDSEDEGGKFRDHHSKVEGLVICWVARANDRAGVRSARGFGQQFLEVQKQLTLMNIKVVKYQEKLY